MQSVTSKFNFTHAAWVMLGSAIGTWILVAFALGWMSPTTHKKLAAVEVQQALVPICANRFAAMPAEVVKFNAAQTYNRSDVIRVAIPKLGTHDIDYTLARLCADEVSTRLTTAAASK